MNFSEFLTYPYIVIYGLMFFAIYFYFSNKQKTHIIWREKMNNLNNRQILSALAILTELITKYQKVPLKRKDDLFCQLARKTIDLFAFEYAVLYSDGFEILAAGTKHVDQTSEVLDFLEEKKAHLCMTLENLDFLMEIIEHKEGKTYIYILKLLEKQKPQFIAFVQKLCPPSSTEGIDIKHYELSQSFLPVTQEILSSSIRWLLLHSLEEKDNKLSSS